MNKVSINDVSLLLIVDLLEGDSDLFYSVRVISIYNRGINSCHVLPENEHSSKDFSIHCQL